MLALPPCLISIDSVVLSVAVPALSAALQPTGTQLLWIIDIYSFILAGVLVLMGTVGDRIGRRRLLLIGAPVFGLSSVIAAFSTSASMLIAARVLLGLGGATLMPSTLALIRSIFIDAKQRRMAVAIWSAAFAGGAAFGPVMGGLLLEHFWWGSVFLINAPLMVLFVIGTAYLVPESRDPMPGRFDVLSALMSIAGILPVVYALKTLPKEPGVDAVVALVVGGVVLYLFMRRQRRLPDPMIDTSLFRIPTFSVSLCLNIITIFTLVGTLFYFPQYLGLVRGFSSLEVGLWLLPLAGISVISSLVSPALANKLSVRSIISFGLACLIVGLLGVTLMNQFPGITVFAVASALVGLGIGLSQTLANDLILTTAPADRAGAASAISETAYEGGAAMGTAVLGTIGLSVYASRLGDIPGISPEVAAGARETLGAAHELARGLPGHLATQLELAADEAFLTGITTVAVVAMVACCVGLVLAHRGLKGV